MEKMTFKEPKIPAFETPKKGKKKKKDKRLRIF